MMLGAWFIVNFGMISDSLVGVGGGGAERLIAKLS